MYNKTEKVACAQLVQASTGNARANVPREKAPRYLISTILLLHVASPPREAWPLLHTSEVNPDIGIPESRDFPTIFRPEFPTGKFSHFPIFGKKYSCKSDHISLCNCTYCTVPLAHGKIVQKTRQILNVV